MTQKENFRANAPEIAEMTTFRMPETRRRTLPSGLEMVIYDGCEEPVSYLSLVQPGGNSEFPSPAYAALDAIMRREGTKNFSGAQISSILDFNGAWLNIGTSEHHTTLGMRTLNSRLSEVLPVFKEMAFSPTFPEKELEVRRESLAGNIEVALTDVDFIAMTASDRLIKGAGHPGARIDSPGDIRQITSSRLAGLSAKCHAPQQGHIFLSGMITPEVEDAVAEAFSSIPYANPEYAPVIVPYSPAPALTEEKIHVTDASQCSVVLTIPAIGRDHPDYIPLHIAASALGGYFGSRLMLRIREELGLTYGITAALLGSADGAYIQIQADTDGRNADRLCEEVSNEMRRLTTEPPTGAEMWRLRQSLLSAQASILDSPFSIIDYHISELTAFIPTGYFEAKLNAISKLTPETISRVAEKYLRPELLRTAAAGNLATC